MSFREVVRVALRSAGLAIAVGTCAFYVALTQIDAPWGWNEAELWAGSAGTFAVAASVPLFWRTRVRVGLEWTSALLWAALGSIATIYVVFASPQPDGSVPLLLVPVWFAVGALRGRPAPPAPNPPRLYEVPPG